MHYPDTSVLVTALTVEPESAVALEWLVAHQDSTSVSDWTLTEFASALSRKYVSDDIDERTRNDAQDVFERLSSESLTLLQVTRTHFREAVKVCRADAGVRSGDALHIAIARDHGLTLVSRDRAMIRGARELGVDALLLDETA